VLFNSSTFLIFALVFFCFWSLLKKKNLTRWIYLVVSSFFFYGWWDWRFLFLLIATGLIDFFAALAMERNPARKKIFLVISLIGNIGSLAVFKYSGFFAENLSVLLSFFNINVDLKAHIPHFALILPVGISFYTFQSMNYSIDVYRERLKPTHNVFHFFSFLSLFPHLVAGPILRAKLMLWQLESNIRVTDDDVWKGSKLIIEGFFYKIVIADNIAQTVNYAFSSPDFNSSSLYWWYIITLFAFQIYFDFNGYSKIAIGLLKWMGYTIPDNFNHPYLSISLKEFWKRWHISLSSWLRDYLYLPLVSSLTLKMTKPEYFKLKTDKLIFAISIFITFFLSGLWHGAAWTFIIWGGWLSTLLIFERFVLFPLKINQYSAGKFISWVLLIVQVWIGWVFFRSSSFSQAIEIISKMFSFSGGWKIGLDFDQRFFLILALLPEILFLLLVKVKLSTNSYFSRISEVIFFAILLLMCVFLRGPGANFIYFQF
jgi:D-alanyl-lipoteichoic acid acyltransferase DltB (MBOAT superfamily)